MNSLSDLALYGVMPILAVALVLLFIRLVRGPSLPDRVVALDLLTSLGIGIIAAYAIGVGHSALLDVAIAMALLSFLSTVAFAYYLERRV
jgi:multicomponent Na+:H+ antiporter subunit F